MNKIETYNISIPNEIEMTFLNYGGIIQSLKVPDRFGVMQDVVLGFENVNQYLEAHPYFGAIVGRFANRIGHGKFQIAGKSYQLGINNSPHSIHGGFKGFDKAFWDVHTNNEKNSYTLSYQSPDGEEGYPGSLRVRVTYTLTTLRELIIDYDAVTTKPTPVNLTSHSYFNLTGNFSENILGHELWSEAQSYLEVDSTQLPTGEILPVNDAMDFRTQKPIGLDIDKVSGGYDHNYILGPSNLTRARARVYEPKSGRILEVFTSEPGMQFYTGNFLDGTLRGKKKLPIQKYQGLCLETQHFPDSPNHPHFPSTVLSPNEHFSSRTIYRFRTK